MRRWPATQSTSGKCRWRGFGRRQPLRQSQRNRSGASATSTIRSSCGAGVLPRFPVLNLLSGPTSSSTASTMCSVEDPHEQLVRWGQNCCGPVMYCTGAPVARRARASRRAAFRRGSALAQGHVRDTPGRQREHDEQFRVRARGRDRARSAARSLYSRSWRRSASISPRSHGARRITSRCTIDGSQNPNPARLRELLHQLLTHGPPATPASLWPSDVFRGGP